MNVLSIKRPVSSLSYAIYGHVVELDALALSLPVEYQGKARRAIRDLLTVVGHLDNPDMAGVYRGTNPPAPGCGGCAAAEYCGAGAEGQNVKVVLDGLEPFGPEARAVLASVIDSEEVGEYISSFDFGRGKDVRSNYVHPNPASCVSGVAVVDGAGLTKITGER